MRKRIRVNIFFFFLTIKLSRENVGMKSDEKKEKKQKLNDKTEKEFREDRF